MMQKKEEIIPGFYSEYGLENSKLYGICGQVLVTPVNLGPFTSQSEQDEAIQAAKDNGILHLLPTAKND